MREAAMDNLPIRVLMVAGDEDDFLAVHALLSDSAAPAFDFQRADCH